MDEALAAGWSLGQGLRTASDRPPTDVALQGRRVLGALHDRSPGGNPIHRLLGWEIEAILALAEEWGPVDRSHRKLAHRGSYTGQVWVAPSTVRRVLALC